MDTLNSINLKAGLNNSILERNSNLDDIIIFANTFTKIAHDSVVYIDYKFVERLKKRHASNISDRIFHFKLLSCFQLSLDRQLYNSCNESEKELLRKQADTLFGNVFYQFSKNVESSDKILDKILSIYFYGTDNPDELKKSVLGKKYTSLFYLKRLFFIKQIELIEDLTFNFQKSINGNYRDQQAIIVKHLKRILLYRKMTFITSVIPALSQIKSYRDEQAEAYSETKEIKDFLRGSETKVGLIEALNHSYDFMELEYPEILAQPSGSTNFLKGKQKKGPFDIDEIDKTISKKAKSLKDSQDVFAEISKKLETSINEKKPKDEFWLDIDSELEIMNNISNQWRSSLQKEEITSQKIIRQRTISTGGAKETEEEVILTTDQMIKAIYDKVYEKKEAEKFKDFKDFLKEGKWSTLSEKEKHEYWGKHGAELMTASASNLGAAFGKLLLAHKSEDRIKAVEEFGKSLLLEQGTELLGLLTTLWGGPVVGAFVQGLAGTLLGSIFADDKPDPLDAIQDEIRDLKQDIGRLAKEVREGFRRVFKQNNLIIEQNQRLERLLDGLTDLIKDEFESLKDFITLADDKNRLKAKIDNVNTPIDLVRNSYYALYFGNGKLQFIDESEILDPLNVMLKEFIGTSKDIYNAPIQFDNRDLENGILFKLIENSLPKSSASSGSDFSITIANINRLCDMADWVFKRYEKNRKKHFSNNAIIAFVEPHLLPERCTENFIDQVLRSLVAMEKRDSIGLSGALISYGAIFKSQTIGKGNQYLYNVYLQSQFGEAPTALDGLFAIEVGADGKIIFEKTDGKFKTIPKMIHLDEQSNISFKSEISRLYIDNTEKDKFTRFSYKNEKNFNNIFPLKTRATRFYLGKGDTIIVLHKRKDSIRILPPDSNITLANDQKFIPFQNEWENIFHHSTKFYPNSSIQYSFFNIKETFSSTSEAISVQAVNGKKLDFSYKKTLYHDEPLPAGPYLTFERNNNYTFQVVRHLYLEDKSENEDSKEYEKLGLIDPITTKDSSAKYGPRIFKDGDITYSDNLEYRLVANSAKGQLEIQHREKDDYQNDKYVVIWHSSAFSDLKEKCHLALKVPNGFEANLILSLQSEGAEGEFPMPQAAITEIKLDDTGELRVVQDLDELKNRIKEPERRLIMHTLKKGECLYAGEFLYSRVFYDKYLYYLKHQTDGNLVLYKAVIDSQKNVMTDIQSKWATGTDGEYDHNSVLMINASNKLEILTRKANKPDDKKFQFPQRHVENLFVDRNYMYINHKVEDHVERRLFLYGLRSGDILYPEEKIISSNKKYYFTIQDDGNMRCNGKDGLWYSMVYRKGGKAEDFELRLARTWEVFDKDSRFSGFFTYWGYTQYKEELQHLWASEKDMHKSYTHIEESRMSSILMDDSGLLIGCVYNSDDYKRTTFDIGLISDKTRHQLPKVTPVNADLAKYLGMDF